ncbi:MAG: hypothetical protein HGA53_05540, partial [Anaerolineaceae bacterium]|nr:hypothetical protein [Anaerolineaceae bacterium]
MTTTRPILAITMGDPAGCGPEIIAKAAVSGAGDAIARLICIGDAGMMARAYAAIGSECKLHIIQHPREALFEPGTLELLDLHNLNASTLEFGKVQPAAGKAAYEYITRAIELAMNGDVDGTVTAPINKEALNLAGYHYAGHT